MATSFASLVKRFAREERGATLLEYTILLGLVTAVSVALIGGVGTWISEQWEALNTALGI